MTKKRLVFVTPVLPYPPMGGGQLCPYHLIRNLHADFDIHLVCLSDYLGGWKDTYVEHMTQYGRCHRVMERPKTFPERARDYFLPHFLKGASRAYLEKIQTLSRDADVLHFDGLRAACYLTRLDLKHDTPLVGFFSQNFETALFKGLLVDRSRAFDRLKFALQLRILKRTEKKLLSRVDQLYCISKRDARSYLDTYGKASFVSANGVDTERVRFMPTPDQTMVLFIGNLNWGPNVFGLQWFLRDIYREGEFRFEVVGRADERTDLSYIPSSVAVHKSPVSVIPLLERSGITVVPLLDGGGSRGKILESMAAGKPVVSTSKGAEGLEVNDGEHLLIADGAADFRENVRLLGSDKDLYLRIAQTARRFVETHHDWKTTTSIFREHYLRDT